MSQTSNKDANLKFKKVDISFMYGYVNHNLYKSMELSQDESNGFDKTWAPLYNLNRSADGYYIRNIMKDQPVKVIGRYFPNGTNATLSASVIRKRYNPANIKETDGGPGCLTIKISVESSAKGTFDVKTIYDILNLVPRASAALPEDISKIEGKGCYNDCEMSGRLSRFSPVFRLFCNLLSENQSCWNELYLPPHESCFEQCGSKCERFYSFYDPAAKTDPQIPYIIVEGFLPHDDFCKGFVNKNSDHSMYDTEIGCILERWVRVENRDHLNFDYFSHYKGNDKMIDKENGTLVSRFRDKKNFTLFSSIVTLMLKSEHDPSGIGAAQISTNSILSYLQFLRVQLHNALWLNKQLDKLINEVSEQKTIAGMLPCKEKLNVLKVKVAKSMDNSMYYMWDSVLGQEIPNIKINQNVKKLEEDTVKKLNLINELMSDKIGVLQLSQLHKSVN